jgi:hypothetical protein
VKKKFPWEFFFQPYFFLFVLIPEKDPYPVDALPTCNHALSVCQQERKCIKLFEDFKTHCKVRENKCRMEDRWGWELHFREHWKIVTLNLWIVFSNLLSSVLRSWNDFSIKEFWHIFQSYLKLCFTERFIMKFMGIFMWELMKASLFCIHRDACHEAWTNLRLSPMFGCICPNNHMKRRCDKIFNVVNHNPCVGKEFISTF